MVLCSRELYSNGYWKLTLFAIFVAIFETFTLISFWVHYTGDIVGGVVIGYWVYDMGRLLKDPIDRALWCDKTEDEVPLI